MRRSALLTFAVSLGLLLGGGIVAVALTRPPDDASSLASSSSPGEPPADTPTPTSAPAPQPGRTDDAPGRSEAFVSPAPRTETFTVLDVGTVTLAIGDVLQVVDVQPSRAGWRTEVHPAGRQADVSFRAGAQRVDWKAEFEDGQVRVRVRDRRAEDSAGDGRGRGSGD